jgi:hypothetical protein
VTNKKANFLPRKDTPKELEVLAICRDVQVTERRFSVLGSNTIKAVV